MIALLSLTLGDAHPLADAQYYGGGLLPQHQYGAGLPYHQQPFFAAAAKEVTPADTVKLVADERIPATSIYHGGFGGIGGIGGYGHGLPLGYAGHLGYPGYGGVGHLGYGHNLPRSGYGFQPYGGVGYPYATLPVAVKKD